MQTAPEPSSSSWDFFCGNLCETHLLRPAASIFQLLLSGENNKEPPQPAAISTIIMVVINSAVLGLLVLLLITVTTRNGGITSQAHAFGSSLFRHLLRNGGVAGRNNDANAADPADSSASQRTTASQNNNKNNNNGKKPSALVLFDANIRETLQWWDDLAPPFSRRDDGSADEEEEAEAEGVDVLVDNGVSLDADDSAVDNEEYVTQPSLIHQYDADAVVHFCFLLHGHRGYARDLGYLQSRMERLGAGRIRKQQQQQQQQQASSSSLGSSSDTASSHSDLNDSAATTATTDTDTDTGTSLLHDMVVHAAVCNEKKTTDGVKLGGERLVDEMLTVIRDEMGKRLEHRLSRATKTKAAAATANEDGGGEEESRDCPKYEDITVSVLGNSLGGIYGRYAIAKLAERCRQETGAESDSDGDDGSGVDGDTFILDGRYRIHFNVYCTTASPHLGIAGHTYFPLPRTAEIGVAVAMGETGHDLFRLNDLMKQMATTPEYLGPLSRFRKRIAYANAYGTDFPVPVGTAAFLSKSSEYPHHFYAEDDGVDDAENEDRVVVDDSGLVIATLHTRRPNHSSLDGSADSSESEGAGAGGGGSDHTVYVDQDDTDDLEQMSTSLDKLGWKKVFIDVRKEIPKIALPTSLLRRTMGYGSSENSDSGGDDDNTSGEPAVAPMDRLKEKKVVGSKEVAAAVSKPLFSEDQVHWPSGHNMMVAFSRSRLSTYMNKAGRPVVNALAKELVEDIFAWTPPPPTQQ